MTALSAQSADLIARFRDHLRATNLFERPGTALVAVSGGPDSRALLELMVRAADSVGLGLVVAHVDHGIAAVSADWAELVRAAAARHAIPADVARLALPAGTSETSARRARYRALRDLQRRHEARYVVTGHHADDQVETVLFRMLRGSGVAGLAGIAARGPRGLRRPLLPFRRGALHDWLRDVAPEPAAIVDPSNAEPRHDRSWMRGHLLPFVRQRFPDVDQRLLAASDDAAANRVAWAALVRSVPELGFRAQEERVEVARPPLRSYDKVLSEAILRAIARDVGCVIGRREAARLLAFTGAQSGRVMPLGDGWIAEIVFDRLRIHRPPARRSAGPPVRWGGVERGEARWDGWCITWGAADAEPVRREGWRTWVTRGDGVVRTVRAGDRLRPLGGAGRRKVRRLLMEARVPRAERGTWPVLERDGDIVWLPGICRGAAALPRPGEPALRLDAHRNRD